MTDSCASSSFWSARRVLITGASGLTGSWLAAELLRLGAHVTALSQTGPACDGVGTILCSFADRNGLETILREQRIDILFHLAGQSSFPAAREVPADTLEANTRSSWMLLDAARRAENCAVVIASSARVYGKTKSELLYEDSELSPVHPYDVSKACAEMVSKMFSATYGLPVAIARCGNLFGGGDLNWSRSIPGLIRSALLGERFVIRSDGKAKRDYLYVEDAVSGYLLLAQSLILDQSISGQAFNFGLERGTSLLELSDYVLQMLGRTDLLPIVLGAASDEAPSQCLSTSKANSVLNWVPRFSIEDGLQKCIAWYSSRVNNLITGDAVASSSKVLTIGA